MAARAGDEPVAADGVMSAIGTSRTSGDVCYLAAFGLASARDRLPESGQFVECGVMFGAVRARSVHKACYGHNRDWAAAQPLLA